MLRFHVRRDTLTQLEFQVCDVAGLIPARPVSRPLLPPQTEIDGARLYCLTTQEAPPSSLHCDRIVRSDEVPRTVPCRTAIGQYGLMVLFIGHWSLLAIADMVSVARDPIRCVCGHPECDGECEEYLRP